MKKKRRRLKEAGPNIVACIKDSDSNENVYNDRTKYSVKRKKEEAPLLTDPTHYDCYYYTLQMTKGRDQLIVIGNDACDDHCTLRPPCVRSRASQTVVWQWPKPVEGPIAIKNS